MDGFKDVVIGVMVSLKFFLMWSDFVW
jgi:hypothetical protein